ncbi:hypothetical protein [Sphingomonas montanisoli]|uniref:Uncharacterized protein n=1 Tax=Sphingomonas montanisoli TaxID=2606412 RepID=A0A5D9C7M9_9SPHN|nr:hypothetical protein [Sphingomonas montanisoli]TZG27416.1 hypothetical protein FYJ91_07425 [Sphingomonas montanisoli]
MTSAPISPEDFAARARIIAETMSGHAAHHALDILTNDVLRGLGYGDGIDVFERAVSHWHAAADSYPYRGPCPDCEAAEKREAA